MRYLYSTTNDFTTGYEWLCFYRNYSNVSFRFIFESSKETIKTNWLSPEQAYDYFKSHQFDFGNFISYSIVKRTKTNVY